MHYVVGLSGDFVNASKSKDINIKIIKLDRNSIIGTIRILFFLNKFCKSNNIDIIHSHHRYFDFIIWLLSKSKSIKTVTSVHNIVYGKKLLSYKSKNIIAVSSSVKNHLINYFKIPEKRIHLINNFVDPSEIKISIEKEDLKKQLNIKKDAFLIGYIGRLNFKEKGVDILINAFQILSKKYENFVLILVGNGENENEIKKYILEIDLKIKVIPGKEDVFNYYSILDVVVLPSRNEAFGIALIEAGLIQKSIIGTNLETIKEVINNNNGLLFEKENPLDLAKKIELYYKNIHLRKECAENLYDKVIKSYTSDTIIPIYKRLYQNIQNT